MEVHSLKMCSTSKMSEMNNATANESLNKKIEIASLIKTGFCVQPQINLKTGCSNIDGIINGFQCGINEIYGPAGAGKTQIALQLCLQVQIQMNKSALYLLSRGQFPISRFYELCNINQCNQCMDQLWIKRFESYESLILTLAQNKFKNLITKLNIGLIVLDSIVGFCGEESNDVDFYLRSQLLHTIGVKLLEISSTGVIIIVLNQVVTSIDNKGVKPALGFSWRNLVTSRYFVDKIHESHIRKFTIDNAPFIRKASTNFIINSSGVTNI